MNPLKLTFTANEQDLTKTDNFTDFASNTVSYIEATFTLGENWTGYDSVRAVWKTDYYTISTVLDANFTCIVPTEVLRYKAKVFVNLVGSIVENDTLTDRLTTFPVLALTVKANAAVNGTETVPVTPSQFEQFVEAVQDAAGSISDYSYDSEAWAVGKRGGVDVPSTDETYHNNSKYWAEQNAGLADDVADLSDDVADLKSDLELFTGNKIYQYTKNKSINTSTPTVQNSESNWESVIVPCSEGDVFSVKGYGGSSTRLWMFADSEGHLLAQSEAALRIDYYIQIKAPANAAYISCNSMYTNIKGSLIKGEAVGTSVEEIKDNLYEEKNGTGLFEVGVIDAIDGTKKTNSARLRTIAPLAKETIAFETLANYGYALFAYNNGTYVGWWTGTSWSTDAAVWNYMARTLIPSSWKNYDIYAVIRRTDNGTMATSEASNAIITYSRISVPVEENTNNYAVDSAFVKHIKELTLLGDISLHQSFCIYNNKIYSTNGSKIAVQDLATLAEESRIDLSCGHGNSFQLGASNLAYVSGWDDQKIYVINLDTVTLQSTITLPTTGYTTCAIDDINKIAYIFQLDTSPAVGGYYNFIVYDYDNEQIISTKKITFKIRAMQGIDFYNGRIVVLSGLGSNTDGNKYSIFNTNGDLISELFIGDLENIEPEGVFIDRDTFDIYLSYLVENVGYKLYKLS